MTRIRSLLAPFFNLIYGRFRRLVASLTTLAVIGFVYALVADFLQLQESVCSFRLIQPGASDLCGSWGIGNMPTRAERLAWETLPPGSCKALRAHTREFPNGAFQAEVAELLALKQVNPAESWNRAIRRLSMFIGQETVEVEQLSLARNNALKRGNLQAQRLCSGFAATSTFRLISSKADPQSWFCAEHSSGHKCGFEGQAVCNVEVRTITTIELC